MCSGEQQQLVVYSQESNNSWLSIFRRATRVGYIYSGEQQQLVVYIQESNNSWLYYIQESNNICATCITHTKIITTCLVSVVISSAAVGIRPAARISAVAFAAAATMTVVAVASAAAMTSVAFAAAISTAATVVLFGLRLGAEGQIEEARLLFVAILRRGLVCLEVVVALLKFWSAT